MFFYKDGFATEINIPINEETKDCKPKKTGDWFGRTCKNIKMVVMIFLFIFTNYLFLNCWRFYTSDNNYISIVY